MVGVAMGEGTGVAVGAARGELLGTMVIGEVVVGAVMGEGVRVVIGAATGEGMLVVGSTGGIVDGGAGPQQASSNDGVRRLHVTVFTT